MKTRDLPRWVCCQLGAREHYSIPRALHQAGALAQFLSDVWVAPTRRARWFYPRKLRERYHPELATAQVRAWNGSAIFFEAAQRVCGTKGWELILRRNDWFQERALQALSRLASEPRAPSYRLFSYSYTARRLFQFAKAKGWQTVLGQIDPGPPEERLVARLYQQHPAQSGQWQPAPADYWRAWREECELADRIVVNSSWSQQALLEEGVPEKKIRVVPLAYESPDGTAGFRRTYPAAFTAQRPLRVLFLGQVNLRKGVAVILEAIRLLQNEPVEFWFVGPLQIEVPPDWLNHPQVRWVGGVPRGAAARYYQEADVFLFPTFSDGFGLTQLEAQAWKLPIIASRFCGDVVRHGENGLRLEEISAGAIAEALLTCVREPQRLEHLSRNAAADEPFSLVRLQEQLIDLF